MNYTNGCISLELPENNSESVKYTVPSLPICSVKSNQSDFPTFSIVNHWHTDFEFSLVTNGRLLYMVNGQRIKVGNGDMIFVNAYQMHYGFWEQIEECEFIFTVFAVLFFSSILQNHRYNTLMNIALPKASHCFRIKTCP